MWVYVVYNKSQYVLPSAKTPTNTLLKAYTMAIRLDSVATENYICSNTKCSAPSAGALGNPFNGMRLIIAHTGTNMQN